MKSFEELLIEAGIEIDTAGNVKYESVTKEKLNSIIVQIQSVIDGLLGEVETTMSGLQLTAELAIEMAQPMEELTEEVVRIQTLIAKIKQVTMEA